MTYVCQLCARVLQGNPSKHHLIQANLCRSCYDQIHTLFTEKELEYDFNTIEKLKADERVQKWIKFVRLKPDGAQIPHCKS